MVTYWRHWGLWKKLRWLNKDTGKAYTAICRLIRNERRHTSTRIARRNRRLWNHTNQKRQILQYIHCGAADILRKGMGQCLQYVIITLSLVLIHCNFFREKSFVNDFNEPRSFAIDTWSAAVCFVWQLLYLIVEMWCLYTKIWVQDQTLMCNIIRILVLLSVSVIMVMDILVFYWSSNRCFLNNVVSPNSCLLYEAYTGIVCSTTWYLVMFT